MVGQTKQMASARVMLERAEAAMAEVGMSWADVRRAAEPLGHSRLDNVVRQRAKTAGALRADTVAALAASINRPMSYLYGTPPPDSL